MLVVATPQSLVVVVIAIELMIRFVYTRNTCW